MPAGDRGYSQTPAPRNHTSFPAAPSISQPNATSHQEGIRVPIFPSRTSLTCVPEAMDILMLKHGPGRPARDRRCQVLAICGRKPHDQDLQLQSQRSRSPWQISRDSSEHFRDFLIAVHPRGLLMPQCTRPKATAGHAGSGSTAAAAAKAAAPIPPPEWAGQTQIVPGTTRSDGSFVTLGGEPVAPPKP